ncbi:hypothetical protein LTR86_001177 [Recurvomyces mirabilis]|nr:hypothetical protein LTR86_001177 [Recurvomyces mirabilis]
MAENLAASELRTKIDGLVALNSKRKIQPQLTVEQLAAMAILHNGRPLTRQKIAAWIFDNIPFYRNLAFKAYWGKYVESKPRPVDNLKVAVSSLGKNWYSDFRLAQPKHDSKGQDGAPRLTISPFTGARLLGLDHASGLSDQPFRLFDLPAELRDMIYGFVFKMTDAGIYYVSWGNGHEVSRMSVRVDNGTFEALSGETGEVTNLKPLMYLPLNRELFAPLLTCRGMYREALPQFFMNNPFWFEDDFALSDFAGKLPPSHKRFLRTITYRLGGRAWASYYDEDAEWTRFANLAGLHGLRKMTLYFDEIEWEEWRRETNKSDDPRYLPGLDTILSLPSIEQFVGIGCPELVAVIKQHVPAIEG